MHKPLVRTIINQDALKRLNDPQFLKLKESYINIFNREPETLLDFARVEWMTKSFDTLKSPVFRSLIKQHYKQMFDCLKDDIKSNLGALSTAWDQPEDIILRTDYFDKDKLYSFIKGLDNNDVFNVIQSSRQPYHCSDGASNDEDNNKFTNLQVEILNTSVLMVKDVWIGGKGLWYYADSIPSDSLLDKPYTGTMMMTYGPLTRIEGCFDYSRVYGQDSKFKNEGHEELIKERFLPSLLVANKISQEKGTYAIIHIASQGLEHFAFEYHDEYNQELPLKVAFGQALIKLLQDHKTQLPNIRIVEYRDYIDFGMSGEQKNLWKPGVLIQDSNIVFRYSGDPYKGNKGFFPQKQELEDVAEGKDYSYFAFMVGDSGSLCGNDSNDRKSKVSGPEVGQLKTMYNKYAGFDEYNSFYTHEGAMGAATDVKSVILNHVQDGIVPRGHSSHNSDVRESYRSLDKELSSIYQLNQFSFELSEGILKEEKIDQSTSAESSDHEEIKDGQVKDSFFHDLTNDMAKYKSDNLEWNKTYSAEYSRKNKELEEKPYIQKQQESQQLYDQYTSVLHGKRDLFELNHDIKNQHYLKCQQALHLLDDLQIKVLGDDPQQIES